MHGVAMDLIMVNNVNVLIRLQNIGKMVFALLDNGIISIVIALMVHVCAVK
ncbi:unnamed protein product, partial [Brachionus calyciflorus]